MRVAEKLDWKGLNAAVPHTAIRLKSQSQRHTEARN
jgi:hypothetical protein